MLIAKVVGDLSATRKDPSHEGRKLLLVQPLELDGSPRGNPIIAVDTVNAGINNRVLVAQDGFAAFSALGLKPSPLDVAIVGVIDHVETVSIADPPPVAAPTPAAGPGPKQQHKKNRS